MVRMVLKNYLASLGHTEDDTFLRKNTFFRKNLSQLKKNFDLVICSSCGFLYKEIWVGKP